MGLGRADCLLYPREWKRGWWCLGVVGFLISTGKSYELRIRKGLLRPWGCYNGRESGLIYNFS